MKLLKPENVGGGDAQRREANAQGQGQSHSMMQHQSIGAGNIAMSERRDGLPDSSEGEELDRAFGVMGLK